MSAIPLASATADARSLDPRALENLRQQAKADPDKALKDAALQFEAMFMQMLLKSMRDAIPQGGDAFASEAGKTYTGMLDQQLSQSLSGKGLGLADMMLKQLSQAGKTTLKIDAASRPATSGQTQASAPAGEGPQPTPTQQGFVDKLLPHALDASKASGVPARFILGQAALESGWGKGEIRGEINGVQGANSYNLFGIKAGPNWKGATVSVPTQEFIDGKMQRVVAKFRAYGSYSEGFKDWAQLVSNSPRYAAAVRPGNDAAAFAQGLARGGYATDPDYAAKLTRVINSNLLVGRGLA